MRVGREERETGSRMLQKVCISNNEYVCTSLHRCLLIGVKCEKTNAKWLYGSQNCDMGGYCHVKLSTGKVFIKVKFNFVLMK